ncbi:hypothetical protein NDU88_012969 [Pleurodeles waltl]|uniref:Ig-like domain-containing protein n=1 Tax=Pleurodeles waltl TaxID=8319 RepID=A0AAV7R1M9_PLEWA|nr:hypothetical protein NDU88_012969 [Pleurodeles waltl]
MGDLAPFMWAVALWHLLALPEMGALEVHHVQMVSEITQSYDQLGEYTFQNDGDEIFYVQSPRKEVSWRLPDFEKFTSFDSQGALGNLAVDKYNLDIWAKRSNYTAAKNDPPEVMVFTENPVDLGEPNILICFMNKFFPPVINATWLKNGVRVFEGVAETDFYPNDDFSFRKFLYLSFIPTEKDEYACSVDHWGQSDTVNVLWDAQVPVPPSEEIQTVEQQPPEKNRPLMVRVQVLIVYEYPECFLRTL